jgi:hypothetical protein
MRRKPLYVPTAAVTATAILLTLIGPHYPNISIAIWFGTALLLLLTNRKILKELMARLKTSKRPAHIARMSNTPRIECKQPGSKP